MILIFIVKSPGENCGKINRNTPNFTHYAWNNYNDGTCWLKTRRISISQAFHKPNCVCGVIEGASFSSSSSLI